MKITSILSLLSLIFLMSSCGGSDVNTQINDLETYISSNPKAADINDKVSQLSALYKSNQSMLDDRIKDIGANMYDNEKHRPIPEKAEEYISKSEMYAKLLPGDLKGADYLIKAGETARTLSKYSKAISIYDRVIAEYPNSPKAAQALFLKGFTLDEDLKQISQAKAVYEEFLVKYPDDQFADDTQFLLKNLGVSDDDIISKFEAQEKVKN